MRKESSQKRRGRPSLTSEQRMERTNWLQKCSEWARQIKKNSALSSAKLEQELGHGAGTGHTWRHWMSGRRAPTEHLLLALSRKARRRAWLRPEDFPSEFYLLEVEEGSQDFDWPSDGYDPSALLPLLERVLVVAAMAARLEGCDDQERFSQLAAQAAKKAALEVWKNWEGDFGGPKWPEQAKEASDALQLWSDQLEKIRFDLLQEEASGVFDPVELDDE